MARTIASFTRREAVRRRKHMLRQTIRDVLHRAEAHFGYFLPFRISLARNDELLVSIEQVLRQEQAATALSINASRRCRSTDALLAGARESGKRPLVAVVTPFPFRPQSVYENLSLPLVARRALKSPLI